MRAGNSVFPINYPLCDASPEKVPDMGSFPFGDFMNNVMGFYKCHELSGKTELCSFPISWSWVCIRALSLWGLMLERLSLKCHKKRWKVSKTAYINIVSLSLYSTFFRFRGITLGSWVLRNSTQDCVIFHIFLSLQHWSGSLWFSSECMQTPAVWLRVQTTLIPGTTCSDW